MISADTRLVVQTIASLDSIVDNLLLLLSEKEKLVVLRRFGLKDNAKSTLEAIGQDFGVTRERVRQIERSALGKMKRNVFNSSLTSLHEYVSTLVDGAGGLLSEAELTAKLAELNVENFDADSVHLAYELHENFECMGNTINFQPYIRRSSISDFALKHVSSNLINELQKAGDVRKFHDICQALNVVLKDANFDDGRLKSLVKIDKRLLLLDGDLLGLAEWRHIRPRTLRDKILFVLRNEARPLHFGYIAEQIERKNFDNKAVNVQAVHNELIRHEQFVLVGRGIYALGDWGYERGTVADVIEAILEEKGELSQQEIVAEVLKKRKVKDVTVVLALKNNAKFERVGRQLYALNKIKA